MRLATSADIPDIVSLANEVFLIEQFFVEGDRTDPNAVAFMLERGVLLLALEGERLVGCVYVHADGPRGYFGMLSVDASMQGRGLGRRLVEAAEARCREAGCERMELSVVNVRPELPPFYRHLGYVATGTKPFPVTVYQRLKIPCELIVMAKPLKAGEAGTPDRTTGAASV